jgi:hypothetical protein
MKYTSARGRNGTQIGDGRGSGPRQLDSPTAVAVYISDYENDRIQLWSDGGMGAMVETVLQWLTNNSLSRAEDIQLDPRSNDVLNILGSRSLRVLRWTLRAKYIDGSFEVFPGTSGFHVDAQQTVYLTVPYLNEVFKWMNGRRVSVKGPSVSQLNLLNGPSAVCSLRTRKIIGSFGWTLMHPKVSVSLIAQLLMGSNLINLQSRKM